MKKKEREYLFKYGDIPDDRKERFNFLLSNINLSRSKTDIDKEMNRIKSIKWKSLSFTINIVPKGTPRPRLGKHGVFYVKGAAINKSTMKKILSEHDNIPIITTPVKFICKSFFPTPKSMTNAEKVLAELGFIRPISKPDWDNVGKGYCDMLSGLVIQDDALVIRGVSEKYYSIKPRVEIKLYYMEDHDSNYNRRKMESKTVY